MASGKGHPIFAALYDLNPWPRRWSALWRRRAALVGEAEGRVLDLGVGNGLNFECLRRAAWVVGVDPDPYMLRRAAVRLGRLRRVWPRPAAAPVRKAILQGPAEALPFPEGTFDTVLATFVLCTVQDPDAALREARRVLRPGGALRFLEHVRAPSPRLAGVQDRITPLWSRLFAGCHPNRDTLAAIRARGFTVETLETTRRGILIQGLART
ncbi:MAG TPA: class I SAM-dependent methyltransferase [Candidatus Methylomirabilis sp.]